MERQLAPIPILNIMNLQKCQLYLMQSMSAKGVPVDLMHWFFGRCSATDADLGELLTAGLAQVQDGRFVLTMTGKRLYKQAKKRGDF